MDNKEANKQAQAKSCRTCSKERVCRWNPDKNQIKPFFTEHNNLKDFMSRLCNTYGESCRGFELKEMYRPAPNILPDFKRYTPQGEVLKEKPRVVTSKNIYLELVGSCFKWDEKNQAVMVPLKKFQRIMEALGGE